MGSFDEDGPSVGQASVVNVQPRRSLVEDDMKGLSKSVMSTRQEGLSSNDRRGHSTVLEDDGGKGGREREE